MELLYRDTLLWQVLQPPQRGRDATTASLPVLTYEIAARFCYFQRMLRSVAQVPGEVVECGVGWGRSLLDLVLVVCFEGQGRQVWGFDSFEGFPEPSPEDDSPRQVRAGEWKTDPASVMTMLASAGLGTMFLNVEVHLVKGFFVESLRQYPNRPIALLHIDADLYQSYHDVLGQLYQKVAPGGMILLDEYLDAAHKFPGAVRAIDEFFQNREVIRQDPCGKFYVVKDARA